MKRIDFVKKIGVIKHLKGFPRSHALAIGSLGCSLLLFSAITPSKEPTVSQRQEQPISLPLTITDVESNIQNTAINWQT